MTLADRLRLARRSRFVGRTTELEQFGRALRGGPADGGVWFVHGPGGIGKTALLDMFAKLADEAGRPTVRLDARALDPSPPSFLAAVGAPVPGWVLLLDTYELLAPLDDWLRESYLESLPADALVVIAGRDPPSPAWIADPGWQVLLRVVPLRNLRPADSRKYLSVRGVPDARQEAVIAFTHGHPLALALVADVATQGREAGLASFRPEQEPDVVRVLLEQFVDQVPGPRHRAALEVSAHVRVTTEELLAEALGGDSDDVPALFDWLRGLSFVEQGPQGAFPHDLAREVLDADLRWRNPEGYRRMHAVARAEIVQRIQRTSGPAQQLALFDFLFMYRTDPVVRGHHDWAELGHTYAEPATAQDLPAILVMAEQHEGTDSARIAAHWFAVQPEAFSAFRDFAGEPSGFEATLLLHLATDADLKVDPAARAAMDFARRYGPLRHGDEMIHHRFYMSREAYQSGPATLNLRAMIACRHWFTMPRLAWSFLAAADAEYWRPLYAHLGLAFSPEAAFEVGGRRYAVFTHDWRVEPVAAWCETLGEPAGVVPATPLVVLSEPEFGSAVRQALRDFTRTDQLATNPLVRSRLVVDHAGEGAAGLRALLAEAAGTLRNNPRDEKCYRALHRTYFEPAATQELAAERLGLPFSTYRAHLRGGVERVVALLWRRELSGQADPTRT